MRASQEVRIPNESGLHARPCSAFVSLAQGFQSAVEVACGGRRANGKSILEMMTLSAPCGERLLLSAEGPDADELVRRLVRLVEAGFEEGD